MPLLTPEQAAERLCPFARVHSTTGLYNRPPAGSVAGPGAGARCIAEQCMAWRHGAPLTEEIASLDGRPEGEGWQHAGRITWRRRVENPRGYCGLAGNPQE